MSQVIFCDFDGVIRHWDNAALFATEEQLKLPRGTTFNVAFAAENLIPAITGKVSDEAWRASVTKQLTQAFTLKKAQLLTKAWSESPASIDFQIFKLLKNLLPDAKLALVTNATSRLNEDLANHHLTEKFDAIINSSDIGVAKPDTDFYRLAVEQTGAKLEESIFIDDSLNNVQSARAFGLTGFHFQTKTVFQKEIEAWLANS